MSVLAIDSSRRGRLVCILATAEGEVMAGGVDRTGSTTAGLPRRLTALLEPGISAVVVVNGPGSYTGVRAGLAVALGLGATRRLPIHVVGALEVAAQMWSGRGAVRVLADAGRGGLYTARYARVDGGLTEMEAPNRVAAAALIDDALPRLSLDPLDMTRLTVVDAGRALAGAVPAALARPPIDPRAPPLVYLGSTGPLGTPQV